jgi:hypothetical protein
MTQSDFGTINPSSTSGIDLAGELGGFRDAQNSNHRGASRPSYVVAGMFWIKNVSGTAEELYWYDGTDDILVVTINPTTNAITFSLIDQTLLTSTDAGATPGPVFRGLRNSASPAIDDYGPSFEAQGKDNGGGTDVWGDIVTRIKAVAAGAEYTEWHFRTLVNAVLAARMVVGQGVQVGSPTGGDKGAGSLNAQALYVNGVAALGVGGFKNKVHGGDFSTNPWQYGTSFPAAVNGLTTADRFLYIFTGAMLATVSKSADAPTVAQAGVFTDSCLLWDCTTVDVSIAAGDFAIIQQCLEGYDFQAIAQRAFTLSFWHKHTKTGTYCVCFRNTGEDRCYVAEYTQAVSDTWEFTTVTVSASPAAGTWDYTTGRGLQVAFVITAGSTFQTTPNAWQTGQFFSTSNQVNGCDNTANNFRLALVQVEIGSAATEFEKRGVGQELALCRRYLPACAGVGGPIGVGWNDSTTLSRQNIMFDVPTRIPPTGITVSNGAHFAVSESGGDTATTAVAFVSANVHGGAVTATVAAGLTDGRGASLLLANASAKILFTGAEL